MKPIIWLLGLLVLVAVGAGAFIWSGAHNLAADEPHWSSTEQVMETVRDRSIAIRASDVVVPALDDESLIRTGAGNYDAMCAGCHLVPGEDHTELSAGLCPSPPDLVRDGIDDSAEAFWIIKHGIKMTGMPAWGVTHDDAAVWSLVAFLQKLPTLSPEEFAALDETRESKPTHKDDGHAH